MEFIIFYQALIISCSLSPSKNIFSKNSYILYLLFIMIPGKYLTIPRTEGISTTHIVGRILDHISYSNSSSSAGSSSEIQTHLHSSTSENTDPGSESGSKSDSDPGSVYCLDDSPLSGIRRIELKEETTIGREIEVKKKNGTGAGSVGGRERGRGSIRNQERAYSVLFKGKSNFSTTGSKLRLFSENVQVNTLSPGHVYIFYMFSIR